MGRPNLTPVFSANFEPEQPQGASMARPGQPTSTNDGGAGPININQPSEWTTGLFGCMEDKQNAFITCFLPFNTFGQIAEVVDEGATNCLTSGRFYGTLCTTTLVPCVYSCTFRTKLRSKYGLPEAPCSDWITHCFCECCALCQEYRELKNRGLDPSIGWSGNVQKQRMAKQQEMMGPPMGQRMMG